MPPFMIVISKVHLKKLWRSLSQFGCLQHSFCRGKWGVILSIMWTEIPFYLLHRFVLFVSCGSLTSSWDIEAPIERTGILHCSCRWLLVLGADGLISVFGPLSHFLNLSCECAIYDLMYKHQQGSTAARCAWSKRLNHTHKYIDFIKLL